MKAFQIKKYKGSLEIAEVPSPKVGAKDVLVKIAASSVNQLDEMLRQGTFKATMPYPLPLTLGNDFSGIVASVGRGVTDFKTGDRVYGKPNPRQIGTFAEFIAVSQGDIAEVPAGTSLAEAASFPLVGLTAWQTLSVVGKVKSGQKVLIHGGAGGVGSIAIQVAKVLGATVATTVGTSNVEFAKSLGADVVIDYKSQDFSKVLSGYDLVLDTQGGEILLKSLTILRPGGKVIGIAGPPDEQFARQANLNPMLRFVMKILSSKVMKKAKSLGVSYEFFFVQESGKQLAHLSKLIQNKSIRPVVGKEYRFEDTPAALEALAKGRIGRGKAVVVINQGA